MKLARQARRIHKHFTSSYGLHCAAKIALFRSTGQLQRQNVTLSRWRKGAQLCHAAETKHHEGDPTGLHGRNKYCSCSPALRCAAKIALFRSTGQLQRRNVALSRWRKGAQLCHATETNTMKATQQGCTEGTSTAVVPLPCAVRPK